ncbi:UNVERIFIED_CONTAM: hypothetical protein FKN15_038478 [Acipenser sinensis]
MFHCAGLEVKEPNKEDGSVKWAMSTLQSIFGEMQGYSALVIKMSVLISAGNGGAIPGILVLPAEMMLRVLHPHYNSVFVKL